MSTNRNYMWAGAAVLVVALIIGGTYYLSQKESSVNAPIENATSTEDVLPATDAMRVTAKHSFDVGTHTIVGEIAVPTPCHSLDVSAMVAESFPEQVTIVFSSTNPDEMCIQQVSNRRFKVSFQTSENASIRATWNGEPIFLNLIPATPEETENFDIYLKG